MAVQGCCVVLLLTLSLVPVIRCLRIRQALTDDARSLWICACNGAHQVYDFVQQSSILSILFTTSVASISSDNSSYNSLYLYTISGQKNWSVARVSGLKAHLIFG